MQLFILLVAAAAMAAAVDGQPTDGFISIDCGLSDASSLVDSRTNLTYVSDAQFIDAGVNCDVSPEFKAALNVPEWLYTVRSFPSGKRNCYTLTSLVAGQKYLIRAWFRYGNYDGLNKPPAFDIYIGVNFWVTVNGTNSHSDEIITQLVSTDTVQVCFVNTGGGVPFVSAIELRPLNDRFLYPAANATQALSRYRRYNLGPSPDTELIRYPADPQDRLWYPWPCKSENYWSPISTKENVTNYRSDIFRVPSAVMQTAVVPTRGMELNMLWPASGPGYILINLHISELRKLESNESRHFRVFLNDNPLYDGQDFSPAYLYSSALYNVDPVGVSLECALRMQATNDSTLPPQLNALEIFFVVPTVVLSTDPTDVAALTVIKKTYQLGKEWQGDPCLPESMAWDGVTCSYASAAPQIISLNLSSRGLAGVIDPAFKNLKALQNLDLSGNHLNGSIPSELQKRSQDGSLKLRTDGNADLCSTGNQCIPAKNDASVVAVYIAVPIVVTAAALLIGLAIFIVKRKRAIGKVQPGPGGHKNHTSTLRQFENCQFTYKDLQNITSNFARLLGEGGFGPVYFGRLEDGIEVAVKLMRSKSSSQGLAEFINEVKNLTRAHHKSLVQLIGYCKEANHEALVYEFMSQGTLREHLRGGATGHTPLTWNQRLRILLQSAQGLEYLHRGCSPPLIHRNVKTANILLTAKLEGKIADFGLCKAFNPDESRAQTSRLVGTHGYICPEYGAELKLTEKSDVYSFGVVILEAITGQPPVVMYEQDAVHLVEWVRQRLSEGNIESAADPAMRNEYDVSSVRKAADVALRCMENNSVNRPAMADVVAQLGECLELENAKLAANGGIYSGTTD